MSPVARPLLEAPWGAVIGIYLMLVGLATGVTLVALWVHPADERLRVSYDWRTTWAALLALVAACALLVIDLGRPARFYLMLTSFANLGSPMSIGAKLIGLKLCLLAAYLFILARRLQALASGDAVVRGRGTRALFAAVPTLLGVLSLTLAVYPAVLLARTWSSPLLRTTGAGVLFVSTALLMGTAAVTLITSTGQLAGDVLLRQRLRQTLTFLVLAQGPLLGLWYLSVDTNQPLLATALSHLFQGVGATVFWPVVVGLGLVLPTVVLLSSPGRLATAVCGAVAVLAGASAVRYLLFAMT
jgi:formate-dependent nitrite reductase membrane component NrfD